MTVVEKPPLKPIPLFDLKLESTDIDAVVETLNSGWLTGSSNRGL